MSAPALPPHTRALMRALLERHSTADTHAMLNCSLSGVVVTKKQVHATAWRMKNEARRALVRPVEAAPVLAPARPAPAPKPPLTFEEQLARVAAGAKLVPAFNYRRPDPAYSLTGNATALCG